MTAPPHCLHPLALSQPDDTGDWANAEAGERLAELNIRRVVTIHNHPENLKSKLAPHIK